jgi:hypothetical protein
MRLDPILLLAAQMLLGNPTSAAMIFLEGEESGDRESHIRSLNTI